jgi:hypothetical protein
VIPSLEDLYGQQFRDYLTANAPDCAECGAHELTATKMPIVDRVFLEHVTGDYVVWAFELYRCGECDQLTVKKIELDRQTREEQEEENRLAVARAQMRREEPFLLALFCPRAWEREVLRKYPRREEPDLMQRWKERR